MANPGCSFWMPPTATIPLPHFYQLQATNPCGEQWLGPYENCCLGSINLSLYCAPEGKVNWAMLENDTSLQRAFWMMWWTPTSTSRLSRSSRKPPCAPAGSGLGIMGLADLMFHAGIRYGSPEGQEFAAQVMEFVRFHAMRTSVELAAERGAFPVIKGSILRSRKSHLAGAPAAGPL